MKNALIITATHGIGIALAEAANEYNILSKTYTVLQKGVGSSNGFPVSKTDFIADVKNFEYIDINESFDYIIWTTGAFLHKSFTETTNFEIDTLIDLHYRVPLKILTNLIKQQQNPLHLIVIASCSSWRLRRNEAIYCGLSAAKAAFARNYANDLHRDLPGSKVTLINPGGIRTPFFYEEEEANVNGFLNQVDMAKFIWNSARLQQEIFQEIQYLRSKSNFSVDNKPTIEYRTICAETVKNKSEIV